MDRLLRKAKDGLAARMEGGASPNIAATSSVVKEPLPPWDAAPTRRQIYMHRRQRGVNLGSMFTLETWLTPSLFKGIKGAKSEQDLCRSLDKKEVKARLEGHWNNFIDDGDWKWMAGQGINTVRLPISYYHWLPGHPDQAARALMSETEYAPYADIYESAHHCILNVVEKARTHGIGVLIDLHGAPGGQNTEGHCGLSTGNAAFFERNKNRATTMSVLRTLLDAFASMENVVGIEVLNEPRNNPKLASFYKDSIHELAKSRHDHARLPIYLGDCWATQDYARGIAEEQNSADARVFIVQDHHLYRCFTPGDHGKRAEQHASEIRHDHNGPSVSMLRQAASTVRGNLVIGEWSAALHHTSLRGHDQRQQQQLWATAQLDAYNLVCAGFFFWTLKKEGPSDTGWCLYTAIEQGVLPAGLGQPRGARSSAQQLAELGQRMCQDNFNGHSSYWSRNANGAPMQHEKYRDGYLQAWKDAMAFASLDEGRPGISEIGFKGQWVAMRAQSYAQRCGNRDNEWEFEHGSHKALDDFAALLRN